MAASPIRAILGNRPLMTLASGHFTVDMYSGLLPVLYPILTDRFELDLATVGMVALAYSGASSLSQPLFGWVADRYGTRYTGIALAWSAILFSLIGFAPSFEILVLLAALAGLGSGAFHPFGALNANAVIGDEHRNKAMSAYVTGGMLGSSLGPIIGVVLFGIFGMRGTAVMVVPGLTIGIFLLLAMKNISVAGSHGRNNVNIKVKHAVPWLLIGIIIAVMMLRMFPTLGIQSFIPLWYDNMGYESSFYGPLASTLMFSMAFGTIGAGTLADRYGTRSVMLGSILLSIPAVWGLAEFPGKPGFFFASAIGFLAASTSPLLLVMTQRLMAGRAGIASGFILGLGFVAGAIGAPVFGAIGDAFGMQNAVRSQVLVLIVAAVAAWFLPTEQQVGEIQRSHDDMATNPAPARS